MLTSQVTFGGVTLPYVPHFNVVVNRKTQHLVDKSLYVQQGGLTRRGILFHNQAMETLCKEHIPVPLMDEDGRLLGLACLRCRRDIDLAASSPAGKAGALHVGGTYNPAAAVPAMQYYFIHPWGCECYLCGFRGEAAFSAPSPAHRAIAS